MLAGLGYLLLFFNSGKGNHRPAGSAPAMLYTGIWCSQIGIGNVFLTGKKGAAKKKEDGCSWMHLLTVYPDPKPAFPSLCYNFPDQDKHEAPSLSSRTICSFRFCSDGRNCKNVDINKPMHLNKLYLPRSSALYKWWDVAFFPSALDIWCSLHSCKTFSFSLLSSRNLVYHKSPT